MDQGVALQHLPPGFNPYQQANLRALQQQQQHVQQQQQQQQQQHAIPTLPPSYQNNTPAAQQAFLQRRQLSNFHQQQLPVTGVSAVQTSNPYLQRPIQSYAPITTSIPQQPALAPPQLIPSTTAPVQQIQQPQQLAPPPALPTRVQQRSQRQNVQPDTSTAAEPAVSDQAPKSEGHLEGMKMIPNPPDLEQWRERLFSVENLVVLSEEQSVAPPSFQMQLLTDAQIHDVFPTR
jgi:glutathione S-transferase